MSLNADNDAIILYWHLLHSSPFRDLYVQDHRLKALQTGCSRDFQCQGTPFKRLVTGKKQPGGPGRSGEQRSKRTLEEVAELEGDTPAKQTRRSTRTPKSRTGKGKKSK